jgi:hypothetical protein
MLSEEVKPFTNVDGPGFLRREFQTSLRKEFLNHRFYFLLKLVLRPASDQDVVCEPDQIDSRPISPPIGWERSQKGPFQSVECHVHQRRRGDTSLRNAFVCCEKGLSVNESGPDPFLQDGFLHRNILKEPGV